MLLQGTQQIDIRFTLHKCASNTRFNTCEFTFMYQNDDEISHENAAK